MVDSLALPREPYVVCLPSFTAGFLRTIGALFERGAARAFLARAGKHVEVFLPFYDWFDIAGNARPLAIQQFRVISHAYGMTDLRAVHAGYAGQGVLFTRHYMNPADPRTRKETTERIRRELHLLSDLRRVIGGAHPLLYVLHCGRRERGMGWRESFQAAVATVRSVMDDALATDVCISLENVYSHPGAEGIGTTLTDLGDVLTAVGRQWVDRGVLGWTFDPSHALLAYSGDYAAIERDLKLLVRDCVHLHVNHPRTARDAGGEFLSAWGSGDDAHTAPVRIPQRTRYWTLVKTAIEASRMPTWRTITYEVNWSVPILRGLFGGSPLAEVEVGYDALERFCNHATDALDVPAIERYIDERLEGRSSSGT